MKSKLQASLLAGLCLAYAGTWAQVPVNTGNGLDNPDWKEEQVPPPPSFSKERVVAIDMPRHVTLRIGVDPDTIVVGADGVVRYVIVMVNSTGSVNAVYEGIRCASDEFKTYARWSASGTWSSTANPEWRAVNDNMPSRHTLAFARQGGCINRLAPTKAEILQTLKSPKKTGITSLVN